MARVVGGKGEGANSRLGLSGLCCFIIIAAVVPNARMFWIYKTYVITDIYTDVIVYHIYGICLSILHLINKKLSPYVQFLFRVRYKLGMISQRYESVY